MQIWPPFKDGAGPEDLKLALIPVDGEGKNFFNEIILLDLFGPKKEFS